MKSFKEYLAETQALRENASAGATSAANVASSTGAVGGLGVGFDPNGDHGIYEKPKKKVKKTEEAVVLRRAPY